MEGKHKEIAAKVKSLSRLKEEKKIKTLTLKEGGKMRNETGAKVIKKNYCTQNKGDCLTCSLSSYHLDCRSQSICRANDGQAVTEVESIFGGFKMEKSPYQKN